MRHYYTKAALLSICLTGILFSILSFLFTGLGILYWNSKSLTGFSIGNMPIEIIMSSFIIPPLGLYLYNLLNFRFPDNDLEKFSLSVSNLLLGICIALLFFGYLKWYSAVTFFMLFTMLFYIEYVNKLRFMYRFYRLYILLLIPFYAFCILIKKQSTLLFNENATLKLKLAYVPIEAYFYFMGLLLLTVYLFELFKSKTTKANG